MRGLRSILIAALLLTLCVSCRLDHLYYASSDTATVLVEPDWSRSGIHPNGVTVFAFDESDGSLYKRFPPVSAQEKCYIKLPEGDFTLVVMNDTPEEFDGTIAFEGSDNLNTFIAKGVKDEQKSKKLSEYLASKAEGDDDYCIVEPDTLVVSVVKGLHIAPEHIDYYYDKPQSDYSVESAIQVDVEPAPVISSVNIQVHVKGLKYARGTTLSYFRGVSAGHYPALGVNSSQTVAQAFILNNKAFDPGSDSDGTIKADFLSFGLVDAPDGRYYLDINFVLINGESYPLSFDVTDNVKIDVSLSLQLSLNLNLDIELPEVVGDEDKGGFNTDVSDWEDEIVDIPM